MMDDVAFDMLREDVREIKSDVKDLLSLKWKIVGAASLLSALVALLIEVAFKYEMFK